MDGPAKLDKLAAQGDIDVSLSEQRQAEQRVRQRQESRGPSFALESAKGAIKRTQTGSKPRPSKPPDRQIDQNRALVDGSPNVAEGIETLTDYLVGAGYNVAPRNIPYTDAQLKEADISDIKMLFEMSDFETVVWDWVWHALVDGMAFMEINWSDTKVFKPRLLPPKRVSIQYDEYGEIVGYEFEAENKDEPVELGKYDVAHLGFWKHPEEDWYRSIVNRVDEQSQMLRDMEIDMARFVATKAYPPILWKLGTEESEWSDPEVDAWLEEVSNIEPDSMLAAPHDVEPEAVGVSDTASSSGAMDLQPTFEHLQKRQATGLGLPYFLLNGDTGGRNDRVATMPKFDKRIRRLRQIIRNAVEGQIFHSIFYHPNPEESEGQIVPKFEFGEHSSQEQRLEVDKALNLFNNGFLKREAFARRVGIDPETEMPSMEELQGDLLPVLKELAGKGDDIQNPAGGSPTDTGGGADSPGGEAATRQNPERDNSGSDSRSGSAADSG